MSGLRLFNEINVNNVAKDFEFCLPFQFCSKLFCLGHCKSTIPNDDEFLTEFMTSKKWFQRIGGFDESFGAVDMTEIGIVR